MVKKKSKVAVKKADTERFVITKAIAQKVLKVVDAGLVSGMGDPKPGQMCVEAAVAYAFGEDHDDHPKCVLPAIADFKIHLNDYESWSDWVKYKPSQSHEASERMVNKLRAKTLRRLAIAQLGSKGVIPHSVWCKEINKLVKDLVTQKGKSSAEAKLLQALKDLKANKAFTLEHLEYKPVNYAEIDDFIGNDLKGMQEACEAVVQLLIKLKSPGTKFLYLTK